MSEVEKGGRNKETNFWTPTGYRALSQGRWLRQGLTASWYQSRDCSLDHPCSKASLLSTVRLLKRADLVTTASSTGEGVAARTGERGELRVKGKAHSVFQTP